MTHTPVEWDVFISHASEDKEGFVRPLASLLRNYGLRVWYDEFTLRLGDSLSRSIDSGLARSQFGIVVLSHSFFRKEWPQRELDGLVAKQMAGGKPILPLWHGIDRADILARSTTLADRVALDTSSGPEHVAQRILEIVHPVPQRSMEIASATLRHVTHEIMTPLDAVLAHTEWLQSCLLPLANLTTEQDDRVRKKLSDIKDSVALIEILMHTIGPLPARDPTTWTSVTVPEELRKAFRAVAPRALRGNVSFECGSIRPCRVLADKGQLRRVFYALLDNAIRYADYREPSKWAVVTSRTNDMQLILEFADNGIGFVAGEEEAVFDMFRRGSNAAAVSPIGAGMGLAYARQVVTTLGGSLVVIHRAKPTVLALAISLGAEGASHD